MTVKTLAIKLSLAPQDPRRLCLCSCTSGLTDLTAAGSGRRQGGGGGGGGRGVLGGQLGASVTSLKGRCVRGLLLPWK